MKSGLRSASVLSIVRSAFDLPEACAGLPDARGWASTSALREPSREAERLCTRGPMRSSQGLIVNVLLINAELARLHDPQFAVELLLGESLNHRSAKLFQNEG